MPDSGNDIRREHIAARPSTAALAAMGHPLLATVAGALIGALATVVIALYFASQMKEVEARLLPREAVFALPEHVRKDLRVLRDGAALDDISILDVQLINRGWLQGDLDPIEIRFHFSPKERGTALPVLISADLIGPPPLERDGIKEINRTADSVQFRIDSLRKTWGDSGYTARFVFAGKKVPLAPATVVVGKDVRVVEYRDGFYSVVIWLVVGVVLSAYVFILLYFSARSEAKRKFDFQQKFRTALLSTPAEPRFTAEDTEAVLQIHDVITRPKPFGLLAWARRKFGRQLQTDSQPPRD
jgi:hypothetical protein